MRKSIISAAALASVTSFAFLPAVEPAAAKPMNTCSQRHVACSERCVMNNKGDAKTAPKDGVGGCISRTCDHQMKACMAGTRDVRPNEGQGPIIRDKRTRR